MISSIARECNIGVDTQLQSLVRQHDLLLTKLNAMRHSNVSLVLDGVTEVTSTASRASLASAEPEIRALHDYLTSLLDDSTRAREAAGHRLRDAMSRTVADDVSSCTALGTELSRLAIAKDSVATNEAAVAQRSAVVDKLRGRLAHCTAPGGARG